MYFPGFPTILNMSYNGLHSQTTPLAGHFRCLTHLGVHFQALHLWSTEKTCTSSMKIQSFCHCNLIYLIPGFSFWKWCVNFLGGVNGSWTHIRILQEYQDLWILGAIGHRIWPDGRSRNRGPWKRRSLDQCPSASPRASLECQLPLRSLNWWLPKIGLPPVIIHL